ncbi:MAG: hypothetical protein JWN70_2688 [Planctomycetaceae bacterium]|nr:hypothetical protein [Planctomycetaceae bacterium]
MIVRFPASVLRLPIGGRLPARAYCVIALLSLFAIAISAWSQSRSPVVPDRLVSNQLYDIVLSDGHATVDLYLEQDVSARLLISNLGSANRNGVLQVRAEPLSGRVQYQPVRWQQKRPAPSSQPLNDKDRLQKLPERQNASSRPSPTRDFWLHVTDTPLENPQGYQLVHSRLAGFRETVEVYADSSLHSPSGIPVHVENLANEIATRLSRDVLPMIEDHVGPIADPDQNGRITVLLTPWLGRLRGGTTQVRGFVRSSDLRADIAAPFSNHADLLYLNSELPTGDALQSLLLHEVTHTALASRQNALSHRALPDWDDWLNEGLAHLTERLGRDDWSNLDYRVARYWQNPAAAPLVVRDYYRTGRWRNHGCRGATFLFLDWCQRHARKRGVTDFVPALMATGKTDREAVEQVCQAQFAELYRAWTISLATEHSALENRKIGRFLRSGPRFQQWNVTDDSPQDLGVSGSATRFMELRASRAGWYRLQFQGDPLDEWQVTLIPTLQTTPAISLNARWSRADASEPMRLIVACQSSLPVGWSLDEVSCEMIREPHPRAWNWTAASLDKSGDGSEAITLPLSTEDVAGGDTIIKVRFKSSAGQIAWSWVEVPASDTFERIAADSRVLLNTR